MRKYLFILPTLFTLSSIACAFVAVITAVHAQSSADFITAGYLIVGSMLFDMLDGRIARMTKTQSAFGVEIDSLADLFSFGAAPALLIYEWGLKSFGAWGTAVSFLYLACAAMRLARFNVIAHRKEATGEKGCDKFFIGLPVPGAAMVLVTAILVSFNGNANVLASTISPNIYFLIFTLFISFFMISNIKFRTFKDVKPHKASASWFLLLLHLTMGAMVSMHFKSFSPGLMLIGLGYIFTSLFEEVLSFRRRNKDLFASLALEDDIEEDIRDIAGYHNEYEEEEEEASSRGKKG